MIKLREQFENEAKGKSNLEQLFETSSQNYISWLERKIEVLSQQREPLLAYHKHLDSFKDPTIYNASESMIDDYLANNCSQHQNLTNVQAKEVAVNTCNKELDEISKTKQISKNFREIFINFVEKNNGWVRIEPDGSNLPELGTKWKWFDAGNNLIEISTIDCKETFLENYTHYKETEVDYRPKY